MTLDLAYFTPAPRIYKQASPKASTGTIGEVGSILEDANTPKRAIDDACLYAREAIAIASRVGGDANEDRGIKS